MAQAIYVIVHIDVMNAHIDAAEALIRQHAADSRNDPGCVRFESLQETGRRNHFTVVEVWKDKDALEEIPQVKPYIKTLGERPAFKKVNEDRKVAQAAAMQKK